MIDARKIACSFRLMVCVGLLALLNACVSSGPATTYYSLFPHKAPPQVQLKNSDISLGVGPLTIPEYLDNPSIVSLTNSQRIRVAGYHAWAGDIKESMTRVLAANISASLQEKDVWAFPWDNRVRPRYQLRMVFDEFAGELGGEVELRARWTLLDLRSSEVLYLGSASFTENSLSDDMDGYVAVLNRLLNSFSSKVAGELAARMNKK